MGKIKNMLIVTGGSVDIEWTEKWLKRQADDGNVFDYCIAADSGLESADMLGLKVDYLLGDYDSVNAEVLARYRGEVENAVFPREKDYTDTELAVKTALDLFERDMDGRDDDAGQDGGDGQDNEGRKNDAAGRCVTILGATGTRMDHTLANIGLLEQFESAGIEAFIIDRNNRIRMIADNGSVRIGVRRQFGTYISCAALTPKVKSLTMQGFKYNLDNYELWQGVSICVSNEITGNEGVIKISEGKLLILETRD